MKDSKGYEPSDYKISTSNTLNSKTLADFLPNTLEINIGYTAGTGIKPYEKIVVRNGDKKITITMEKLFKVLEELFNE